MQNQTLAIGGMTCAACTARIERGLKKLDGIGTVVVNYATEKATITYNADVVRPSAFRETVVKLGYSVLIMRQRAALTGPPPMRHNHPL